jgi:ABC-type branched-subunit amino acid transport system substrate-binding protein
MNTSLKRWPGTNRALAASTSLGIALVLASCGGGGGGGNGPGSTELSLVIGNSLPLSGDSSELGSSGDKASKLALAQIRAAIGYTNADHTVSVVQQDQGTDADQAVEAAKSLVNDSRATCLTGPWTPDALLETAKVVAIPSKVLEISPTSAGEDVTELSDHDLVDSTALPESVEGDAISKAIERDLGAAEGQTVNVAASNDSYGDSLTQNFIDAWQGQDGTVGGQVVLAPPPLSSTSTSGSTTTGSTGLSSAYSTQASQITTGSPDAILLIDDPAGFAELAPALSSTLGWDPATAWGSDQLVSPGLPDQVGPDVMSEMRAVAPGTPAGEGATAAFVHEFKSAEPRSVKLAPFAAQEFDATVLCYLAAVAAGSTDGQKMADELIDITAPGGDEFTWQQLPDAIKALEDGKDIDYMGASGPIDMDVHGNPTNGVFDVYRYTSDGGLEVADEVSVSKPNPAVP